MPSLRLVPYNIPQGLSPQKFCETLQLHIDPEMTQAVTLSCSIYYTAGNVPATPELSESLNTELLVLLHASHQ